MLGSPRIFFGWQSFGNWPCSLRENNMGSNKNLRFRDFTSQPVNGSVLNPPAVWIKPQSMLRQCDILQQGEYTEVGAPFRNIDQNNNNNSSFPKAKLTLRLRPEAEDSKLKNYVEIPIIRISSKDNAHGKGNKASQESEANSLSDYENDSSDYENMGDEDITKRHRSTLQSTDQRLQSLKLHGSPHRSTSPALSLRQITRDSTHKPRSTLQSSSWRCRNAEPVLRQGLPVAQDLPQFFTNSSLSSMRDPVLHNHGRYDFTAKTHSDDDNDDVVLVEVDDTTKEPYFGRDTWIEESDFVMLDEDSNDPSIDLTQEDSNSVDIGITRKRRNNEGHPPKFSGLSSPILIETLEEELSQIDAKDNISARANSQSKPEQAACRGDDDSDLIVVAKTTTADVQRHKPRYFQQIEEDILSSEMLSDEAINLGQNLLHKHFPEMGGFEDTSLGAVYNFSECKQGKFIQILHDLSCHWVCVSNIGCKPGEVRLYDPLYYGIVKPAIQKQISCIMKPPGKYLHVHVQPIQKQQNSTDCGIFALAFATSLLVGEDPTKVVYDISQLRPHLMLCLEKDQMTPFPTLCEEGNSALLDLVERIPPAYVKVALVCSCRAPFNAKDKSDDLVACDSCGILYHTQCENIPLEVLELDINWRCASCRQSGRSVI